jgi:hypothetical protein
MEQLGSTRMRRIWARKEDEMAEDLIAEKVEVEEVAGNVISRLAIHHLLILVELGSLAFDLAPLAYVCIKKQWSARMSISGTVGRPRILVENTDL